jgi:hypothetical protein
MTNRELFPHTGNNICEAYGCSATATEEIKVPVGQIGKISLNICYYCRTKFVRTIIIQSDLT